MKSALIVAALLGASAFAQKPPAPAPPAATKPVPTELESTQLENLELKEMLLDQEENSIAPRRAQLTQQYGSLIRKVESEHPGFVWNPQVHGLVPMPPAAKPAEAPRKAEAAKK